MFYNVTHKSAIIIKQKMKYFIAFVLLSALFGCQTGTKLQLGELIVTGGYCKYPDNDFLILPIQLFRNGELIRNDTIEFSRGAKFEDLPYGKYSVKFESIYDRDEKIEFEIESKNQKITLCIDRLNYGFAGSNLLIDQLKPNQSLKIDFVTFGCFNSEKSGLEIIRKNEQYLALLNKTEIVLNEAQVKLVREFEIELREVQTGWCTTSDTYTLTLSGNSERTVIVDKSCSWRGFDNLMQKLGLKNSHGKQWL